MGSGINNKIYEYLCNSKNVKKRRNTRLENFNIYFVWLLEFVNFIKFINFIINARTHLAQTLTL